VAIKNPRRGPQPRGALHSPGTGVRQRVFRRKRIRPVFLGKPMGTNRAKIRQTTSPTAPNERRTSAGLTHFLC